MATETASETPSEMKQGVSWGAGGLAGLIAGIPFGLMIQFMVGAMGAVGALWGFPMNIGAGWVIHLINSIIFGLVFAWFLSTNALSRFRQSWLWSAGAGIVYGIVVWFIFIGFVWPIWLGAVGFPPGPMSLPAPYFAMKPLIGHLVYGVILGALYVPFSKRF